MSQPLYSSVAPLAVFMFVSSITPGPNNIMLAAAGAQSGFRATVPHMLGISCGLAAQIAMSSVGVGALILASSTIGWILRIAGAGYLLYLGIQLARAAAPTAGTTAVGAAPLGFMGAAAFQFINPKAWIISLTVSASMLPKGYSVQAAIGMTWVIVALVNLPCIACWSLFGAGMRHLLQRPLYLHAFNGLMAAALAGTAAWVLLSE